MSPTTKATPPTPGTPPTRATVREIEEIFREAQATGRLVYRQTSDGSGEQVRLDSWNPEEHTELFVAPRLAGG